VKKAAKDIIVLKDDVKADENAALDDIIKWWKTRQVEVVLVHFHQLTASPQGTGGKLRFD
jgi:hypothetical protein